MVFFSYQGLKFIRCRRWKVKLYCDFININNYYDVILNLKFIDINCFKIHVNYKSKSHPIVKLEDIKKYIYIRKNFSKI